MEIAVAVVIAIAISTIGLFSSGILGTHSMTIPIRITDTLPTGTDTVLTILTINLFTKPVPDTPIRWLSKSSSAWLVQAIIVA
jgi:hypothetical protein